jgi:2,3-bisphosphoglycerate-independent phosphoglycerate mutase
MGRYWAMDRDLRWERTKKAYFALTKGQGQTAKTPLEAIQNSYDQGKTDEFIEPTIITDGQGRPKALIKDNDSIIFFNFRVDRPRQLSKAFVSEDFQKSALEWDFDPYSDKYEGTHNPKGPKNKQQLFERGVALKNLCFVMMTEYGKPLVDQGAIVAYPPEKVDLPLGRVISEAGLRQLRVAESEKERFVTFYFNGQHEAKYDGEERIIIPSPKVPTYDQKPEMSAREITQTLLSKLRTEEIPFVLINYANPDMVGHTGNIGPAVKACEIVDECVGKLANFTLAYGGTLLITADHGNVEDMINSQTGQIDTEHSASPVPFIALSKEFQGNSQMLHSGILADIAPTVLALLGLNIPDSMTGRNLFSGL